MAAVLQAYRDAIATRVHAVCIDRNLDPDSLIPTEAQCLVDHLLPQLIELAHAVGPGELSKFEAVVEQTICGSCGNVDVFGTCRVREQAGCCLYRYLPLVYDALSRVAAHAP